MLHYGVHDRYRFADRRLTGRTVLTVRRPRTSRRFNLDFLLPVRGVRVDGVRGGATGPRRHEVQITPGSRSRAGQLRGRGSYAGGPGAIGYRGERNWLADRHEVVTMNQPHMATWWFPGQRPPHRQGAD